MSVPVETNPPSAAPPIDLTTLIAASVTPIATQAAQQVATTAVAAVSDTVASLHAESKSLISDLAARVTTLEPAVAQALAKAGSAVLQDVTEDVWLQRAVVLIIVGATVVGALSVLACALLGNHTAQQYVGQATAAIVAAALWVSRTSFPLPKPAGK